MGQGYLLVTPAQMAVVYAAIANGGTVVTPTVGREVEDPNGRVVQELSKGRPTRTLEIDPGNLSAIREGLYLAANGVQGTSTSVFGSLPEDKKVAGKTGTAEPGDGGEDHSWFVGYAPYDAPSIVVSVVIERGGTGANAAAPVVVPHDGGQPRVRPRALRPADGEPMTTLAHPPPHRAPRPHPRRDRRARLAAAARRRRDHARSASSSSARRPRTTSRATRASTWTARSSSR